MPTQSSFGHILIAFMISLVFGVKLSFFDQDYPLVSSPKIHLLMLSAGYYLSSIFTAPIHGGYYLALFTLNNGLTHPASSFQYLACEKVHLAGFILANQE